VRWNVLDRNTAVLGKARGRDGEERLQVHAGPAEARPPCLERDNLRFGELGRAPYLLDCTIQAQNGRCCGNTEFRGHNSIAQPIQFIAHHVMRDDAR